MATNATGTRRPRTYAWRILLLVVFVITLCVPFFNRTGPALLGFPFFYWYQMLMVPVSSFLIFLVFRAEDQGDAE